METGEAVARACARGAGDVAFASNALDGARRLAVAADALTRDGAVATLEADVAVAAALACLAFDLAMRHVARVLSSL